MISTSEISLFEYMFKTQIAAAFNIILWLGILLSVGLINLNQFIHFMNNHVVSQLDIIGSKSHNFWEINITQTLLLESLPEQTVKVSQDLNIRTNTKLKHGPGNNTFCLVKHNIIVMFYFISIYRLWIISYDTVQIFFIFLYK